MVRKFANGPGDLDLIPVKIGVVVIEKVSSARPRLRLTNLLNGIRLQNYLTVCK